MQIWLKDNLDANHRQHTEDWCEKFADSLLREDFNGAMEMVKFYTPILRKKENKYKLLAMTHFVFAKGIGNFNKSRLKILVEHQMPIKEEIIKWSIIHINGEKIRHKKMIQHRLFEWKIYNFKSKIYNLGKGPSIAS